MAELKPFYFKNMSARHFTVGGVGVAPQGVAMLEGGADHKGLQKAIEKGHIAKADKKEYDAFTDPASVKAAAEKAQADKDAGGKKEGE